jgi:hypothetical protein
MLLNSVHAAIDGGRGTVRPLNDWANLEVRRYT